jgi:hypothetical protein
MRQPVFRVALSSSVVGLPERLPRVNTIAMASPHFSPAFYCKGRDGHDCLELHRAPQRTVEYACGALGRAGKAARCALYPCPSSPPRHERASEQREEKRVLRIFYSLPRHGFFECASRAFRAPPISVGAIISINKTANILAVALCRHSRTAANEYLDS